MQLVRNDIQQANIRSAPRIQEIVQMRGFEATSPQILRGEGLPWFFPSPDPTHVGASGTGSAPFCVSQCSGYEVGKQTLNFQQSPFNIEASRQQ